ncbi:MAG: hypothetical protein WKF83_11820 [Nocardioidaceae bacterium]
MFVSITGEVGRSGASRALTVGSRRRTLGDEQVDAGGAAVARAARFVWRRRR